MNFFSTMALSLLIISSIKTQSFAMDNDGTEKELYETTGQRPVSPSPPVDKNLLRVLETHFLETSGVSSQEARRKALAQYKVLKIFAKKRAHQYKGFPNQPQETSREE